MSSTFADLGVPDEAVRALRARGLETAFPIQTMAIPPALEGRDVCGRAPTGSGKTIAFGIPIAASTNRGKPRRPTALILAPTRELVAQIEGEMALLLGRDGRKRVASFYGGVGFGNQLNALRRGIDVAVACPGRLKDLMGKGAISLQDVSIVVIDEADRMADMGFLPEVRRILDQVRPDRQTLLFSATLDGDVDVLVKRYQNSPVKVAVEADSSEVERTVHEWVDTRREDRVDLAAHYVATHGSSIVFCRTKHGTDRVARQLAVAGIKAVPIHGGRSQAQRDRALAAFSTGRAHALVATDVAARGIHVDDVKCVVHFDLAGSDKDYLHRSGRTGRAGAEGLVVSFVTQSDTSDARSLQKALGQPLSPKWGSNGLAAPESTSVLTHAGARVTPLPTERDRSQENRPRPRQVGDAQGRRNDNRRNETPRRPERAGSPSGAKRSAPGSRGKRFGSASNSANGARSSGPQSGGQSGARGARRRIA